jgi:hypothetical protein
MTLEFRYHFFLPIRFSSDPTGHCPILPNDTTPVLRALFALSRIEVMRVDEGEAAFLGIVFDDMILVIL